VSIRPGWFYHPAEDSLVKSPLKLFEIYMKSVGRGSNLLLNVPPDRQGLISPNDSAALMGFKHLQEECFQNSFFNREEVTCHINKSEFKGILNDKNGDKLFQSEEKKMDYFEIRLHRKLPVNCFRVKEMLNSGQRIKSFSIEVFSGDSLLYSNQYTTIGISRLVSFPTQVCDRVIFRVKESIGTQVLYGFALYQIPEQVAEE
jgi:alpha-L-fucosidase